MSEHIPVFRAALILRDTKTSALIMASDFAPEDGPEGCYLTFEAASGGRMMIFYTKSQIPLNAIGFMCPGPNSTIQGFKFRQAGGRSELIKGIAGGKASTSCPWSFEDTTVIRFDGVVFELDCTNIAISLLSRRSKSTKVFFGVGPIHQDCQGLSGLRYQIPQCRERCRGGYICLPSQG